MTGFRLRGEITDVEGLAGGRAVRVLGKLRKAYGRGRWRKLKGRALGTGMRRSSAFSNDMAKRKRRFVLCVNSGTYKASLEPRKVYRVLGEDYLFPTRLFVPIEVPEKAVPVF